VIVMWLDATRLLGRSKDGLHKGMLGEMMIVEEPGKRHPLS
jgi:hypothetical protein